MNSSPEINEVVAALATAQAEFPVIDRNRTVKVNTKGGGSYEFTYATLDHILAIVRPILGKHNLCIVQVLGRGDESLALETRVLHASGQWISTMLPVRPCSDPQALGSELTYKRRYSLAGLLGIAAEEDDDGNRAKGQTAEPKPKSPPKNSGPPPAGQPAAAAKASAKPGPPEKPDLDKAQAKVNEIDSAAELLKFAATARTTHPALPHYPAEWLDLVRMLLQRATDGATNEGWSDEDCNAIADEIARHKANITRIQEREQNAKPNDQEDHQTEGKADPA